MTFLGQYNKTISAAVTAAVSWVSFVVASPSADITAPEYVLGATGILIALGVWSTSNEPRAKARNELDNVIVDPAVEPSA